MMSDQSRTIPTERSAERTTFASHLRKVESIMFVVATASGLLHMFSLHLLQDTALTSIHLPSDVHENLNLFRGGPHYTDPSLSQVNQFSDTNTTSEHGISCGNVLSGPCCAGWDLNIDSWWLQHPDWDVSSVNSSMTCFSRTENKTRVAYLNRVHDVQWNGNCSLVRASPIISSGFSADINGVAKGFYTSVLDGVPFHVSKHREGAKWHYTARNDNVACNSTDMLCYFLPITKCQSRIGQNDANLNKQRLAAAQPSEMYALWWYMTRPQQWLRRRIYDFIMSNFNSTVLPTPCTVFHVRRTDIGLTRGPRMYIRLQEYLNASGIRDGGNILLLTDDQSVIEEAEILHPNYNWMYTKRQRFRGNEGKFEDQIPSGDPVTEVLVILAELMLTEQCNQLVHTSSGFSEFIMASMTKTGKQIERVFVNNFDSSITVSRDQKLVMVADFMKKLDADIQARKASLNIAIAS